MLDILDIGYYEPAGAYQAPKEFTSPEMSFQIHLKHQTQQKKYAPITLIRNIHYRLMSPDVSHQWKSQAVETTESFDKLLDLDHWNSLANGSAFDNQSVVYTVDYTKIKIGDYVPNNQVYFNTADAEVSADGTHETVYRYFYYGMTDENDEGIKAEKAMLAATNNVNTHKGAVFSLGLFVCACAYCQKHGGNEFEVIQMMTRGLVKHDLGEKSETAGERQFLQYGKGGVRAEAEAGYPLVRSVALPFLAQTSGDLNTRLLDTLMEIVSEIEDSNLIKRAGLARKLYGKIK